MGAAAMPTEQAREQMIQQQVRAWDVLDDRVLDALRRVPRERFVPPSYVEVAFADVQIPLPHDEHMLRPMVVGRMLQALEVAPGERVLEVGAGTGFVTACLAALGARVRSLEIHADLAKTADANLRRAGFEAEVAIDDAMQLAERSAYDVVALTGSLPLYDPRFERALKPGGRLFVVVGEEPVMEAELIRRVGEGAFSRESLFETVVKPLVNAPRHERFTF
jgi:protein-L-isoaspartate(D-aspartate) O-methyltransferase